MRKEDVPEIKIHILHRACSESSSQNFETLHTKKAETVVVKFSVHTFNWQQLHIDNGHYMQTKEFDLNNHHLAVQFLQAKEKKPRIER
jgi:hypothetical protein